MTKEIKKPETHTVFGIVCNQCLHNVSLPYWKGEDQWVAVNIFDRDKESLTEFTKRFLIVFKLKAFNGFEIEAQGTRLSEAQHNMYGALRQAAERFQEYVSRLQERKIT